MKTISILAFGLIAHLICGCSTQRIQRRPWSVDLIQGQWVGLFSGRGAGYKLTINSGGSGILESFGGELTPLTLVINSTSALSDRLALNIDTTQKNTIAATDIDAFSVGYGFRLQIMGKDWDDSVVVYPMEKFRSVTSAMLLSK